MKKLLSLILGCILLTALLCLTACGGCERHVDADNDLLCDNCGEVYDDGITVTFTVVLDTGKPLSGVKLVLDDIEHYELTLDANGQITTNVAVGIYEVSVDGYLLTVDLIKVKQDTTAIDITAMDTTLDGSREKPFYINEQETELSLNPGEEIFFNYRGSSVKFATVYQDRVVINYNGESIEAVNGQVNATIQPGTLDSGNSDAGRTTIFSVKNVSDEALSIVLYFVAPEGSSENPFELNSNELTVTVNSDTEIYYVWTATQDGTLILTVPSEYNDITLRKIVKDDVPKIVKTEGEPEVQMEVSAGEIITIIVSANQQSDVEISLSLEIR